MKPTLPGAASVAGALLGLIAQGVFAAPTKNPATPLIMAAAQQTAAPTAAPLRSDAEINRAAAAARRDQDPIVNGSVKDIKPASETRSEP